jgi:hypothetical protein
MKNITLPLSIRQVRTYAGADPRAAGRRVDDRPCWGLEMPVFKAEAAGRLGGRKVSFLQKERH